MGRKKLIIAAVLLVFAVLAARFLWSGPSTQAMNEKVAADILAGSRLVAFKPIDGEPWLKRLVVVEPADGKLETRELAQAYAFAVSPDDRRVAYAADDGIYIISLQGEGRTKVSSLSPKYDLNTDQERLVGKVMEWSPDGLRLAFVCGGDLFEVYTQKKAKPQMVTKKTPNQMNTAVGTPAMSPRIDGITCPSWIDNETLVYQDFYSVFAGEWHYYYRIMQVDADGKNKKVILENGREALPSPQKTKLLYHDQESFGGTVRTADIDGKNPRFIIGLLDEEQRPMSYTWSEDGKWVLFDGFAVNAATGRQMAFAGDMILDEEGLKRGKSTKPPSFSPDGKWLIYSAPRGPKLVKVEDGAFAYDSSPAFEALKDLDNIVWVRG